jgi:hypothetical protein
MRRFGEFERVLTSRFAVEHDPDTRLRRRKQTAVLELKLLWKDIWEHRTWQPRQFLHRKIRYRHAELRSSRS